MFPSFFNNTTDTFIFALPHLLSLSYSSFISSVYMFRMFSNSRVSLFCVKININDKKVFHVITLLPVSYKTSVWRVTPIISASCACVRCNIVLSATRLSDIFFTALLLLSSLSFLYILTSKNRYDTAFRISKIGIFLKCNFILHYV